MKKITVNPSDNIFFQLGQNTYDFKDLLSELIDNALAARLDGELLRVRIELTTDENGAPLRFTIWDDASGIPFDRLSSAITPAGLQTQDSLNEHGLGMKQAVAALGQLESLTTKVLGEAKAYRIPEFRFGEIEVSEVDFDRPHGTSLSVGKLNSIVSTNSTSYTRTIVPYLGARYRRFLRPDNPQMNLSIEIHTVDKKPNYRQVVQEVKPVYFHPGKRENRPVISKYPLRGSGWEAELTFGYAPKDDSEYEELGLAPPNKFHPYRVALATQGLDLILHDRVILFHQLSEVGIVNQKHPNFNSVRGELVLLRGFSTAITKNSMIQDSAFAECITQAREILTGERDGPTGNKKDYLQHKSYPEELPEQLLRDRLASWLKDNPMKKCRDVSKEFAVGGIEGFIDILADREAWELKKDQASALDVY